MPDDINPLTGRPRSWTGALKLLGTPQERAVLRDALDKVEADPRARETLDKAVELYHLHSLEINAADQGNSFFQRGDLGKETVPDRIVINTTMLQPHWLLGRDGTKIHTTDYSTLVHELTHATDTENMGREKANREAQTKVSETFIALDARRFGPRDSTGSLSNDPALPPALAGEEYRKQRDALMKEAFELARQRDEIHVAMERGTRNEEAYVATGRRDLLPAYLLVLGDRDMTETPLTIGDWNKFRLRQLGDDHYKTETRDDRTQSMFTRDNEQVLDGILKKHGIEKSQSYILNTNSAQNRDISFPIGQDGHQLWFDEDRSDNGREVRRYRAEGRLLDIMATAVSEREWALQNHAIWPPQVEEHRAAPHEVTPPAGNHKPKTPRGRGQE